MFPISHKSLLSLVFIMSMLLSAASSAELVEFKDASGLTLTAEYQGEAETEASVIILHGFLQTRDFGTVERLANALYDTGYAVLRPTLSLGLDRRKQSLSCEAIHNHSIDQDADEVKQWIDWMVAKHNRPVVLIGHSAGGGVLLKYIESRNNADVSHSILISISYADPGPRTFETEDLANKARQVLASGKDKLDDYALNYCKSYPTFAAHFLSYYEWGRGKIMDVLGQYAEEITVVLGSGDTRIDAEWRELLHKEFENTVVIDGANHFFDQAHEFDLNDAIEEIINEKAGS